MHELFLTAVVTNADFEQTTAVLQGLCAMSAWQSAHRVLFFNGPAKARGFPNGRSIQPSLYAKLWSELNQHLSRQSFVLTTRYEVFKERDFGTTNDVANGLPGGNPIANFSTTQGTLRWTDIPDPTGNRPVTQRKKIEIPDQKNLMTVLSDNNHRFKSEIIEESYTYFRDNIEYSLVRYYQLPPTVGSDANPQPLRNLPPWDGLQPVDPAGKWMLFVRSHVLEDSSPEKMQKAHDELMGIREELMGVFEFQVFDRRAHDTRLSQQVNNMPAPLPQTVRA